MSRVSDKLFDLCPSWLYRLWDWVRYRPRWIKWWLIRANGRVPACDCWEFNDTIARTLEQGLSWMLYHGASDSWINIGSKVEQRSDLIFVKNVMSDFLRYHGEGFYSLMKHPERQTQHQKDLERAFGLLAKYMWGLWD